VGFESEGFSTLCVVALHFWVLISPLWLVWVRDRDLVTLGEWPPSWLGGCVAVSYSWEFVMRPGLLLHGACEVVLSLAISRVEEKLTIRRSLIFVRGSEKKVILCSVRGFFMVTRTSPTVISLRTSKWISRYIFISVCLDYLYIRVYFLVIAFRLKVIYIMFITCEIYLGNDYLAPGSICSLYFKIHIWHILKCHKNWNIKSSRTSSRATCIQSRCMTNRRVMWHV
jgi:hypothetical protein